MLKSIRTPLILFFIMILVTTNLAIITYALNQSYKMLEFESSKGLSGVVEGTNKLIQSRLNAEIIFLNEIANNPILDDNTPWEKKVSYLQSRANSRGYVVFAMITMDGEITRYDLEKSKGTAVGRDYFEQARRGIPSVSDVIISSVTGEPIIVIAVPVFRNGKIIGVLNGVRPQTGLNGIIEDFRYGESGLAFVLDKSGKIMAHTNRDLVLNQVNFSELLTKENTEMSLKFQNFIRKTEPGIDTFMDLHGKETILAMSPVGNTNWILVASADPKDIYKSIFSLRRVLYLALYMILLIGVVFTFITANLIIKPLKKITMQVDDISNGNLSREVDAKLIKKKNEIGTLSRSFERMRQEVSNSFNEIQLANRQLEQKVEERTKELSLYVIELERTQIQLVEIQKQVMVASLIKWIAHQINTPLGTLVSSVSFLRLTLEKETTVHKEEVQEPLILIEKSIKKIVNIIDALKKITMSETLTMTKSINLLQFIKEYTSFLLDDAKNNIEYSIDDSIIIEINPTILLQVTSILIENVLMHAYESDQIRYIRIEAYQDDINVYIKIIDHGKGISNDFIEQLFRPFYEKLTTNIETRINLQIAYNQVSVELKGHLYLEPRTVGSCFVIQLPLNLYSERV